MLDVGDAAVSAHYAMMRYHLGWADASLQPQTLPSGKRLRPILCLLACSEVGGDVAHGLPAAAGIELLHNFSLIHDDIEDGDEMRRHRPTVWKLWGIPQAINAGDGMFTLAFAAFQRLGDRGVDPATTLAALDIFTQTCLALTEGQHLDIGFESRDQVRVDEYLRMIQGKTAALVGASVALGALIGGASPSVIDHLRRFGHATGLAFQIQDDILGIWGEPEVTGKAAGNDILRRKKSLPLLYALNHAQTGKALHKPSPPRSLRRCAAVMALLDQAGAAPTPRRKCAQHAQAEMRCARWATARRFAALALANSLLHRSA